MKHTLSYLSYTLRNRLLEREKDLFKRQHIGSFPVEDAATISRIIREKIESGEPFAQSRFGTTELSCLKAFEFDMKEEVQRGSMHMMQNYSGFFPPTIGGGQHFLSLMQDSMKFIDVQGIWFKSCEDYFIKEYCSKDIKLTYMFNNEPWRCPENPWSRVLKGKKVLVIHPFANTIRNQYAKNQKNIFQGTDILPAFDLQVLPAVQTIAGNKDERFADWFEALDFMYDEALKIDFDVAIIGCGAYGYPLAAMLKKAGKQVCHLGGATQGLFGIKCKRFDEDPEYEGLRSFYNDAWVYPSEEDIPQNFKKVEDGCYWKP